MPFDGTQVETPAMRQAAMMTRARRQTGQLGTPDPYYGPDYDPSRPRARRG